MKIYKLTGWRKREKRWSVNTEVTTTWKVGITKILRMIQVSVFSPLLSACEEESTRTKLICPTDFQWSSSLEAQVSLKVGKKTNNKRKTATTNRTRGMVANLYVKWLYTQNFWLTAPSHPNKREQLCCPESLRTPRAAEQERSALWKQTLIGSL